MATKRLYRSRKGQIFGVCQGIADWRDLPVDTLRVIVALAILVTGVFPGLVIYGLCWDYCYRWNPDTEQHTAMIMRRNEDAKEHTDALRLRKKICAAHSNP